MKIQNVLQIYVIIIFVQVKNYMINAMTQKNVLLIYFVQRKLIDVNIKEIFIVLVIIHMNVKIIYYVIMVYVKMFFLNLMLELKLMKNLFLLIIIVNMVFLLMEFVLKQSI